MRNNQEVTMNILLEENPRKKTRSNGMYWDNPYDMPFENPRRRRKVRHSRNPFGGATKTLGGFSQGIGLVDVAGAIAGLAAANAIPGIVLKNSNNKLLKVVVAIAAAFGAGYLLKMVAGERAGKMAVAGGLAGAAIAGLGSFGVGVPGLSGPVSISRSPLALPAGIGAPMAASSVGSESAIITNIT